MRQRRGPRGGRPRSIPPRGSVRDRSSAHLAVRLDPRHTVAEESGLRVRLSGMSGAARSVHQRLHVRRQDLLGEHRRAGDPDAGQHVVLADAAAGGALGADRDPAGGEHRRSRSASGAASGSANSSARPGRRTTRPRRSATGDTSAPAATAVAATVNAWLQRSASSAPQVTLTTSGRAMRHDSRLGPMPFELPDNLHPDCGPVAWLLGTWRGNGHGDYPTIEPFQFGQELIFTHDGRPFFHYMSRAWIVDENGEKVRDAAIETGFLRCRPEGKVELLLTHNTGFVEIWYGTRRGRQARAGHRRGGPHRDRQGVRRRQAALRQRRGRPALRLRHGRDGPGAPAAHLGAAAASA